MPPTLVSGLAALSACAPLEVAVPRLDLDPEATHLVVTVHGAGREPSGWAEPALQEALDSAVAHRWDGLALDWQQDAASTVRAVANGLAHGDALGQALAAHDPEHVLLVGHSTGAAVVHAATTVLVDTTGATVHAVYLDPFLGKGLAGWGFGVDRYGAEATFAEQLLHRDDPVPATSRALEQAWVVDVSGAEAADPDLPGHDVAIALWRDTLGDPDAPFGWPLSALSGADPATRHARHPRGTVVDVTR